MFQELKNQILKEYKKHYPFFQGSWKSFSSKDIRQLIDLIETNQNERVSEKWIYTHLKPEASEKLPRKDMLDIFSKFIGYTDWEEFLFKHQNQSKTIIADNKKKSKKTSTILSITALILIFGIVLYVSMIDKKVKTIEIKNQYTKKPLKTEDFTVYSIKEGKKSPISVNDSKIEVHEKDEKLVIESPYFKKQEVDISQTANEILVKPDDYALVLKTFIESDIKDWETRKETLERILSDNLEVIILFKDDLGAEYLNKKEFKQKLIVPTNETRKMKIINLETNQKQITFIRIRQL
ncbi:hypothetical protein [Flavobacterium panacagri]|uniref:hypothetical protein n=1 Tax=Flavobacterium panacagri TaxID=3034146 RepID=UPI0025A58B85|nr:hypothetical protein [Flavobacterium panacagri]